MRLKSYLRYKTITSQNVPSEAQVKNVFVSKKIYFPFSRCSSFNHLMIYQICDVPMMMSILNISLNHNSLTHQTWSIKRYKQAKYFTEIFWTIWRTGAKFQALFSLATCSYYSITNYVNFPVFNFVFHFSVFQFFKGESGRIKNGKYRLLKVGRSRQILPFH